MLWPLPSAALVVVAARCTHRKPALSSCMLEGQPARCLFLRGAAARYPFVPSSLVQVPIAWGPSHWLPSDRMREETNQNNPLLNSVRSRQLSQSGRLQETVNYTMCDSLDTKVANGSGFCECFCTVLVSISSLEPIYNINFIYHCYKSFLYTLLRGWASQYLRIFSKWLTQNLGNIREVVEL